MAEPAGKRFKSSLPLCTSHRGSSSRGALSLQAPVEEALCGVSGLLFHGAYRLCALSSVFERDDMALPRIASFFHHEALKQQEEAQAMLQYLAQRGGTYCGKDIQRPGCESVCAVLPALDLLLLQLKEEVRVLVELNELAQEHGDPQTSSTIKSRFLMPREDRLKQLGDLLTNGRRLGCTGDSTGGFGAYLLNELQEELRG